MLRRVIIYSPGSLRLAVTHVGQFLKCISSGNKALNLFGWKQLVVSQIQMPTRVLSANLLDECWINFFLFFIFRNTLPGGEGGRTVGFVLAKVLSPLWPGAEGKAGQGALLHCCRQELAGPKTPPFWCSWSPGSQSPGTEWLQLFEAMQDAHLSLRMLLQLEQCRGTATH